VIIDYFSGFGAPSTSLRPGFIEGMTKGKKELPEK
jgi:hypothetical protein